MPYVVRKKGEEWCVYNSSTDDEKACHDSEEAADRQVKLLNAIEHNDQFPRATGPHGAP